MKNINLAQAAAKKLTLCFFILSMFLAFLSILPSVQAGKFVHTQGKNIVDANNNNILFKGINLGNWLLWEGYLMMGDFHYKTHSQFLQDLSKTFQGDLSKAKAFEHQWRLHYVDEQAIEDIKNLGFNSVRVPFSYQLFWANGKVSDQGFAYIDRLIGYCKSRGIYILLDMHAAPGYQNPGDHSDNLNSNANQPRASVGFWDGNNIAIASKVWRHIAQRYKDEPIIWGYDLINEPVPQPGREYQLLNSLITLRNAIRAVDNNHIIVAEGAWWASDLQKLDWLDANTQKHTGITYRWDNNLVYQTHHYTQQLEDIALLNERKSLTDKLNIPLILGEYGESSSLIIKKITQWSSDNAIGYFPWSFKKVAHNKALWTIYPNQLYRQVIRFINQGGTPPDKAYEGMIHFSQHNIANGSAGIVFDQAFYDAVKSPN